MADRTSRNPRRELHPPIEQRGVHMSDRFVIDAVDNVASAVHEGL